MPLFRLFLCNAFSLSILRKRSAIKETILRPTGETSSNSSNFSSQHTSQAEEDLIEVNHEHNCSLVFGACLLEL